MASKILSPANQITILRILFVPPFAYLVLSNRYEWSLVVLAAAVISDFADGMVARRFHQESALGMALDPIADKIFMATAFLIFAAQGLLPWWLTIMVLTRDVAIVATALLISLISGYRSFPPSIFGKLSTVAQAGTLLAALGAETAFFSWTAPLTQPCIYTAAAMTLISGLHYTATFLLAREDGPENVNETAKSETLKEAPQLDSPKPDSPKPETTE